MERRRNEGEGRGEGEEGEERGGRGGIGGRGEAGEKGGGEEGEGDTRNSCHIIFSKQLTFLIHIFHFKYLFGIFLPSEFSFLSIKNI
jgi:hypothetical protein